MNNLPNPGGVKSPTLEELLQVAADAAEQQGHPDFPRALRLMAAGHDLKRVARQVGYMSAEEAEALHWTDPTAPADGFVYYDQIGDRWAIFTMHTASGKHLHPWEWGWTHERSRASVTLRPLFTGQTYHWHDAPGPEMSSSVFGPATPVQAPQRARSVSIHHVTWAPGL